MKVSTNVIQMIDMFTTDLLHINEGNKNKLIDLDSGDLAQRVFVLEQRLEHLSAGEKSFLFRFQKQKFRHFFGKKQIQLQIRYSLRRGDGQCPFVTEQ